MPWRWGWPPWVSRRVLADREHAVDAMERATVDLAETRQHLRRTERVVDGLRNARAKNHFSESMEALFASAARGHHGPQRHGG